MDLETKVQLNNGINMPIVGFGVFKLENGKEVENAVLNALQLGYRSIDTAQAYHNEEGVGRAVKASGIPRNEIFIATKVKNELQGYKSTIKSFYNSLKELQTDYIDLFLVHWPREKLTLETWRAMEELYEKGLVRAIGVSNFNIHHLEFLLANCRIPPAVNQVEINPENSQPLLLEYCREKNIRLEAWGPLMEGNIKYMPEIIHLAKKYNKTPAQVVLRWDIQKGIIIIPKSARRERIKANTDLFDFELSEEDMQLIDSLNKDKPRMIYYDKYKFLVAMFLKQRSAYLLRTLFRATLHKTKKKLKFMTSGALFAVTEEFLFRLEEIKAFIF